MPRRVSPEIVKTILKFRYKQNMSIDEIALRTRTSKLTVYCKTRAVERGFATEQAYQEYLAQRRDHMSFHAYARQLIIEKHGSIGAYHQWLAERRRQRTEYQEFSQILQSELKRAGVNAAWLAREINVSREQVSQYLGAEALPDDDVLERIHLVFDTIEQRNRRKPDQKRAEYLQPLGTLIDQRLAQLGKDDDWLAAETGIPLSSIINYHHQTEYLPRKGRQELILRTLEVPYATIEAFVEASRQSSRSQY